MFNGMQKKFILKKFLDYINLLNFCKDSLNVSLNISILNKNSIDNYLFNFIKVCFTLYPSQLIWRQ